MTGVTENNVRTFAQGWTGTGSITGSGDLEKICLAAGQYMESEITYTGTVSVTLLQNTYAAGDTILLKYRHGATQVDCLAASWNTYSVPFSSLGYVQLRTEPVV